MNKSYVRIMCSELNIYRSLRVLLIYGQACYLKTNKFYYIKFSDLINVSNVTNHITRNACVSLTS